MLGLIRTHHNDGACADYGFHDPFHVCCLVLNHPPRTKPPRTEPPPPRTEPARLMNGVTGLLKKNSKVLLHNFAKEPAFLSYQVSSRLGCALYLTMVWAFPMS